MFTVSLSTIYSISKTLGPELEILSNLNITERFHFLYLLKKSIINENVIGRITSKSKIFNDPFELLRYRKGVSLQSRSLMLATSLFLPHSIVMGLSVDQVNIDIILDSSRNMWCYWGLAIEEFEFLLRKDAVSFFKLLQLDGYLNFPTNSEDSLRVLLFSTLREFSFFSDKLIFNEDNILFKTDNNLTNLEKDFGFISRSFPDSPESFSFIDYDLEDKLIRVALSQRKEQIFSLGNSLKRIRN